MSPSQEVQELKEVQIKRTLLETDTYHFAVDYLPGQGVNLHIKFKRFSKSIAQDAIKTLVDVEEVAKANGFNTIYTFAYNEKDKEGKKLARSCKFINMAGFDEIGRGKLDGDPIVFFKKELL